MCNPRNEFVEHSAAYYSVIYSKPSFVSVAESPSRQKLRPTGPMNYTKLHFSGPRAGPRRDFLRWTRSISANRGWNVAKTHRAAQGFAVRIPRAKSTPSKVERVKATAEYWVADWMHCHHRWWIEEQACRFTRFHFRRRMTDKTFYNPKPAKLDGAKKDWSAQFSIKVSWTFVSHGVQKCKCGDVSELTWTERRGCGVTQNLLKRYSKNWVRSLVVEIK